LINLALELRPGNVSDRERVQALAVNVGRIRADLLNGRTVQPIPLNESASPSDSARLIQNVVLYIESAQSAPIHLQGRLRHIAVNPRARILKLEQVQLSKVFLLYPTTQLQECGCFTHNFRCAAFLAGGKHKRPTRRQEWCSSLLRPVPD
jgi:hypothetical protein